MAKKLVFDRSLSIYGEQNSSTTVPKGEVWKACTSKSDGSSPGPFLYDDSFSSIDRIIGEGTEIRFYKPGIITGIAFKVVEE